MLGKRVRPGLEIAKVRLIDLPEDRIPGRPFPHCALWVCFGKNQDSRLRITPYVNEVCTEVEFPRNAQNLTAPLL